jgi:hypothetical protein
MEKNLEEQLKKEKTLVKEKNRHLIKRKCPCYGKCSGIYGCPDNYEDCDEYVPDSRIID